nr:extracellular solute-binding protein [Gleimia europaea]
PPPLGYTYSMRIRPRLVMGSLVCALLFAACAPTSELTFLCSNDESVCEQWRADFEHDSGISTRFLRLPTSEALARLTSTRAEPEFDIWVGGPSDGYALAKERNLLQSYRPKHSDAIPKQFKDEDAAWFGVYGSVLALCSNPDVLEANDLLRPTSWKDLENPSLKTWISASSPLTSGTAFTALWTQAQLFGSEAEDHLEKVYANVARFTHSGTAPASVVAAGDAAVAISFAPYCEQQFDSGVQLDVTYPSEGTFYEVGGAGLLAGTRAQAEAEAMLDWLSSKPGQEAIAKAGIPQSPINRQLPNNLESLLATSNVKILDATAGEVAQDRAWWLEWAAKRLEFSK